MEYFRLYFYGSEYRELHVGSYKKVMFFPIISYLNYNSDVGIFPIKHSMTLGSIKSFSLLNLKEFMAIKIENEFWDGLTKSVKIRR